MNDNSNQAAFIQKINKKGFLEFVSDLNFVENALHGAAAL
jgi:hypothetical protein